MTIKKTEIKLTATKHKSTRVKSVKKANRIKLINGCFSADEANDFLMSMFFSKIHYYEMRNFSSRKIFGIEDKISNKQISILKKSMRKISQLVQKAESKGESLSINTEVNITFKKIKQKKVIPLNNQIVNTL